MSLCFVAKTQKHKQVMLLPAVVNEEETSSSVTSDQEQTTPPPVADDETKRIKLDNEEEDGYSSTSVDDLELCARCGQEGEVLECDFTGCSMLWHQRCLPDQYPAPSLHNPLERWFCPAQHVDVCFACEEPGGQVLICDNSVTCRRVYHVSCLPELKGRIPKNEWECPSCVEEKSANGLRCHVCNLGYVSKTNTLIKCTKCNLEVVHLACYAKYDIGANVSCFTCAALPSSNHQVVDVEIEFNPSSTVLQRALAYQILQGTAHAASKQHCFAVLDATIMLRKSGE